MEAKLYRALYRLVYATPRRPRRPREQYDDRWVVMVYLWSVLHDRRASWACDPGNWPDTLDRPLISQSRLSVRLRTVGVPQLVERLLSAASELAGNAAAAQRARLGRGAAAAAAPARGRRVRRGRQRVRLQRVPRAGRGRQPPAGRPAARVQQGRARREAQLPAAAARAGPRGQPAGGVRRDAGLRAGAVRLPPADRVVLRRADVRGAGRVAAVGARPAPGRTVDGGQDPGLPLRLRDEQGLTA